MKRILFIILAITLPTFSYAAFNAIQTGGNPQPGSVLQTIDGFTNTWVGTSTLGISGGATTSPGGVNSSIQYNNNGIFGGTVNATLNSVGNAGFAGTLFTLGNVGVDTTPGTNALTVNGTTTSPCFNNTTNGTCLTSNPGTVTSVSVVSTNGFAGTVATANSTPAITLSTTITGLLKGNGIAISAAIPNVDYITGLYASSTFPSFGYASSTFALIGSTGSNYWSFLGNNLFPATTTSFITADHFVASSTSAISNFLGKLTVATTTVSNSAAISTQGAMTTDVGYNLTGLNDNPGVLARDQYSMTLGYGSSVGAGFELYDFTDPPDGRGGNFNIVFGGPNNGFIDFIANKSGFTHVASVSNVGFLKLCGIGSGGTAGTALEFDCANPTISTLSNNNLTISPNGTGTVVITKNVGIGTTTAQYPLVVQGPSTGNVAIGVLTGGTAYGAIGLAGDLSTAGYNIASSPSDQVLYFNRPTSKSIQVKENNGTAQETFNASGGFTISGIAGSANNLFNTATSTGTSTFTIDKKGHVITGGSSPTIGTCGGGTPTVIGDDSNMQITVGTGLTTSCTVNFASVWTKSNGTSKVAPACHPTDIATGGLGLDASTTPTVLTVTGSALASITITVECSASDNFPTSP